MQHGETRPNESPLSTKKRLAAVNKQRLYSRCQQTSGDGPCQQKAIASEDEIARIQNYMISKWRPNSAKPDAWWVDPQHNHLLRMVQKGYWHLLKLEAQCVEHACFAAAEAAQDKAWYCP